AAAFTSGTPTAAVTAGQTYSFTFTASGNPSPTLAASNLPSWLTFNPATGLLSGSTTTPMTYDNLQIVAANAVGSATQTFNVTVTPAAATHFVLAPPPSAPRRFPAEPPPATTPRAPPAPPPPPSSAPAAALPADTTLANGSGSVGVTFNTPGARTVTATDTVTGTITGVSGSITVGVPPA